jgi:hypothetical protein
MDAGLIERIETGTERVASVLLGAAVAYAAYRWLSFDNVQPQLGAYAGGAGVLGYFLCSRALTTVARRTRQFPVSIFDVRELEGLDGELLLTDAHRAEPDELVLTNADQIEPDELLLSDSDRLEPEPLVLDDILTELGPDSRVVRLFDRKAMPTPGQLKSRIDSHLDLGSLEQGASAGGPPDASEALSAALAELRRSLR